MARKKKKYISFKEAKKYARGLNLGGRYDWVILAEVNKDLPKDIPARPHEYYKEWKTWKDFLGFKKKVPFLSFEEAREYIRSLKLSGIKEWKSYCDWDPKKIGLKPPNIPSAPHINYEHEGWNGYVDFLGSVHQNNSNKVFRSFESARKYCRALGLTTSGQWLDYCKGRIPSLLPKPEDIPSNVARQYANEGFVGMNDFLNTTYHRKVKRTKAYRSFEESKRFVHSLKLNNLIEWNLYIKGELPHRKKMPKDIPANPLLVYKDTGWKGFGDWLGTYNVPPFQMEFWSFEKSREFARTLNLTSSTQWIAYCRGDYPDLPVKPSGVPHSVARHYQDSGWVDYKDFLMDEEKQKTYSRFLSYEEAKAFINSLKLKNVMEWQGYLKGYYPHLPPKPANIPSNPTSIYKGKGWVGMGDWLDNGSFPYASKSYRTFRQARKFARSLGLITSQEWVAYCRGDFTHLPKKPIDIPANVVKQYTNRGWTGFKDFLNTNINRAARKHSLPFEQAREYMRGLGLKSAEDWTRFIKGKLKNEYGIKPNNIPNQPEVVYLRDGWNGIESWLGIND